MGEPASASDLPVVSGIDGCTSPTRASREHISGLRWRKGAVLILKTESCDSEKVRELTTRSECLTPCARSPFPTRCQVQRRYLTKEGYPELPTERSMHTEAAVAFTRVRIYTHSTFCHQSLILPPLSPRPPCHSLPLLIIWLTPLTLRLSSGLYPLLPAFMCLQLCARQIPKDRCVGHHV